MEFLWAGLEYSHEPLAPGQFVFLIQIALSLTTELYVKQRGL
jgi:hypothetical protein